MHFEKATVFGCLIQKATHIDCGMAEKPRKIAVITGDLVDSTSLGRAKIERAFEALEASAETQADWHGAPLHFTRHRGDGWQVVLAKPEMALRSALAFRAALRAEGSEFDSYMGLSIDNLEGPLENDLNNETEPAFRDSGNELDILKLVGPGWMSFSGKGVLGAATILADNISKAWTPPQASAVLPFLSPSKVPTQSEVAEALGKTRQAVGKALEAANFEPIQFALKFIEEGEILK